MARFIDAENLNYLMCSIYWGEDEEGNEVYRRTEVAFRTDIEQIPTADVVEVVKCRDCRYFDKGFVNNNGFFVCSASGMEITENDFCSYGERRKDDDV